MISSEKPATKFARQGKPIPAVASKMVYSYFFFLVKYRRAEPQDYFHFFLMKIHELARIQLTFVCCGCRNPVFISLEETVF